MVGKNIPGLSDVVKERVAEMRTNREIFTATAELREVLPQLYTDEARAELIYDLAHKYNLPNGYIEQAVNYYVAECSGRAARLAYIDSYDEDVFLRIEEKVWQEIKKRPDEQAARRKAIQDSVAKPERELTSKEYDIARSDRDISALSIEEALDVIDILEQSRRTDQAADAAMKIGIPHLAVEIYERRGYFEDAAQTAEQAGMLERALNNYEADSKWEKAGEVAEKLATQKRAERQKRAGIQSIIYEAVAGSYTPDEKNLIERAITNYEKARWVEQAVTVAEKMNDPERVVHIYENARKAEDAAEYALKKGMTRKFLEICEKKGHYEIAEGIAKETQQKDRAQLYEKVDAIIKYGHNMDLYKERKQFFLGLESMTAGVGNNDDEGDVKGERRSNTTEPQRREHGVLNYCRRRVDELRDCILVEGGYEAIKALCGVDTTGQLIRKMAMPAISLMGLVGSCTTYIAHDEQKPETPQIVYESKEQAPEQIPTQATIAMQEKYERPTVSEKYQTNSTQQKASRGCGQ
ncbi:hypothetical protein HZC31_05990 [Candidatus Woesearchaeota archaeon]|nr:hypothetical protein [Candidatus Woesearchaeota archaeon]